MIAIPVMRARVAPVLNWCSRVLLFPVGSQGGPVRELQLGPLSARERLQVLRQNGVTVLICGALSLELLQWAEHQGFKVLSGVAGEIDAVLQAYREDRLNAPEFWLPGCRGPRRYRQGPSSGASRSRGRCGGRSGTGPARDLCRCPACGATVKHEPGIPCFESQCPRCGQSMVGG
jgi:predicted Fe-Mo cluster-binding NifX family protein